MADSIAPISAASIRPIAPPSAGDASDGVGFAGTLKNLIGEVEQAQKSAEQAARTYATGQTTDVTATMVSMERASITLALMLQVRSRLLEAYQELHRMQV